MPRVPVHTLDDAPAESRAALERQSERVGKRLNIFAEMAHAPAVMNLYDTVEDLLQRTSSLDRKTREAIHLTVAQANDCHYCQAAYTGAARKAGWSDDETLAIRRARLDGDERMTTLLAVCQQITTHKGHVDDGTWKDALAAGWSERELLEAYADVVRTILTNYFNHLVGTEVDLPQAPDLTS